jgi:hypothetical protein
LRSNGFGSGLPERQLPVRRDHDPPVIHLCQRTEMDTDAVVPPANGAITPDKFNLPLA